MATITALIHRTFHHISLNELTGLVLVPGSKGQTQEVGALFRGQDQFGRLHDVAVSRNTLLALAQSEPPSDIIESGSCTLGMIAALHGRKGTSPKAGDTYKESGTNKELIVRPLDTQHLLYTPPAPAHVSYARKLWDAAKEGLRALVGPAKPDGSRSTPNISPTFN